VNTEHAVHVEGLSKAFGSQVALQDLALEVPCGTVFGLLGRNGAGKTTLLRAVMGLLRVDHGKALVFGADLLSAPIEVRSRVAYVPQEAKLIARLSLERHASLLRRFYPRFDLGLARDLADRMEVDWKHAFGTLSMGNKRKAAVVLALASGADLVVMDEPAAGLDPLARRELYELLIERLGEGGDLTVLLSTHLVADLERLADRVAIIDRGRTLRVDDVAGYTERFVRVQVLFPADVPTDFELPGASTTRREGSAAIGVVDLERARVELACRTRRARGRDRPAGHSLSTPARRRLRRARRQAGEHNLRGQNTMDATVDVGALRKNALKGLLWMDFQRHKEGFLIGLPSIALMALFIGLAENAGGPMFFWMGLAMGIGGGMGFGRGEWAQGVEEYSLGLPPTRSDRYYVRFALGLAFLFCLFFFGLAAGPLGWVRDMWELTPFELPAYRPDAPIWEGFNGPGFYLLSIGLSLAVFSEFYAVCINVERRDDVLWLARVSPFCLGTLLIVAADYHFLAGDVGYLTGALGLAYVAPRTYFGARAFERKDVVLDGAAPGTAGEARRPIVVVALLVGLTVLFTLGLWLYLSRG